MSLRYVEDMAVLQQSMPTGLEGVKGLEKFIKDATPEVQNLLRNECDVIIECRHDF
uniref:Exocyst complex component Sec8 n=1 Tax=Heterorhabditis bacteriophora TaxID=37862 RepID=A0A1I7XCS8_HETBA